MLPVRAWLPAVLAFIASTVLAMMLDLRGAAGPPLFLFTAPIFIAAACAGLPGGIAATAGAGLVATLLTEPAGTLSIADPGSAARLTLFAAIGIGVSAIGDYVRRQHRALLARAAALAAEEARLAAVVERIDAHVDNSPLAVLEWDAEVVVRRWSKGAERIFGWSAAEAVGTSLEQLHIVHPDEVEAARALARDMRAGQRLRNVQLARNLTRDGRTLHCEWYNSALLDADGRLTSVLSYTLDVTARSEAEQDARFLAEAQDVLARSLDLDDTLQRLIRLAIPAFADWCVLDLADRATGQLARRAWAHRDPALTHTLDRLARGYPISAQGLTSQAVRSGRVEVMSAIAPEWFAGITDDEAHRALLAELDPRAILAAPLRVEGEVVGALAWVCSRRDAYGERHRRLAEAVASRAAIALRHAQLYTEAQLAARQRDEFVALVSHELRSPLNAISGWARLLREDPADALRQAQGLTAIARSATAMARLVDDLLDISRAITGKLAVSLAEVSVAEALAHAVDAIRRDAEQKQVTLEAPADCGATVVADEARLQQILGNLLGNALRFTPAGGIIRVAAGVGDGMVEITVADTGRGIPPDLLPHVFDRFTQGATARDEPHRGLGLGLAVVRHLTELQNGTVHAHSDGPGRGATFVVRLPAAVSTANGVAGTA